MKETLERLADGALRWSPVQPLFQWRAARRLTVLAYHKVTTPARFERQMEFLAQSMHPVSLAEVEAAVAGVYALPKRAVLVTFDDGHRSVLEAALPVLEAYNIPAVVYVIAGLVGTDQPYWVEEVRYLARYGAQIGDAPAPPPEKLARALKRVPDAQRRVLLGELRRTATRPAPPMPQLRRDELRRLEAGGVAVGNHTLTHPCLNRCAEQSTVCHEITEAHRILTDALGHEPTSFAYPNGDADARVDKVLAELGYKTGFLFDHRLTTSAPPNPLQMSRLRVNSYTPMNRFRIIVSGLHPTLHHRLRGMN